jgi:predicted metal-dependent phosphoesterase TrpH
MIEIKTDWTHENTHIFLDGVKMKYIRGFRILMDAPDGSRLEIIKLIEHPNGALYVEHPERDEAFIPFEKLTFSDFKITQV